MNTDGLLVYTTAPDEAIAERLARALVEQSLAACVSRFPGVTSVYRWRGDIETAAEVVLMIKTTAEQLEALKAALAAMHPYDVPEIAVTRIVDGHPPWLEWLRESTRDLK
ncbi:MAG: divalent-cation tolerance protein CutA [Pseudomonadota bacterium]